MAHPVVDAVPVPAIPVGGVAAWSVSNSPRVGKRGGSPPGMIEPHVMAAPTPLKRTVDGFDSLMRHFGILR